MSFRIRTIMRVVKQAGFGHITLAFVLFFLLCGVLVWLSESARITYGDSLWICFQTVTTIGFGDVPTNNALCRLALVLLSIVSIFYLAIITGVVVAICNSLVKANVRDSIHAIAQDLDRLPEMNQDELRDLRDRIKKNKAFRE